MDEGQLFGLRATGSTLRFGRLLAVSRRAGLLGYLVTTSWFFLGFASSRRI